MTCRICRHGFGLHLRTCPLSVAIQRVPKAKRAGQSRGGQSRSEYLAAVAVTPAGKRAKANARQRAYKQRRKAAVNG